MREIFRLVEDNFLKTGNPLGVRINSNWTTELGLPKGGKRILFTGLSYQLMPHTIFVLSLLEKGKAVSLLGRLSRFGLSRLIPKKEADTFYSALRAACYLLKLHGLDFGFLYEEEVYDGTLFYDLGLDWLIDRNEKKLKEIFEKNKVKEVFVISPHSYFMLKEVYDLDVEVRHVLEIIEVPKVNYVLHEPCILARKTDFGKKLNKCAILPERSGRLTSCCGGPVELLYPELSKAVCVNRAKELEQTAKESGAGDKFITACPVCLMNFLRCGFNAEDCLTVFAKEVKLAGK